MKRLQGKYALVQFSPIPERFEFLNIGVILMVPELNFFELRLTPNNSRISKFFGKQAVQALDIVKSSFQHRVEYEFSKQPYVEAFQEFAMKRSNSIRLHDFLPVQVNDPKESLEKLYMELVGDGEIRPRRPQIRRALRERFEREGVFQYLDKPDKINLEEYDLKLDIPFGYQNGQYNLIDGVRLSENKPDALSEAGRKAMEGNLIWQHFKQSKNQHQLIVVGDFSEQSNAFFHAVDDQMKQANVKLFRLDDLNSLYRDIEVNAQAHSTGALKN